MGWRGGKTGAVLTRRLLDSWTAASVKRFWNRWELTTCCFGSCCSLKKRACLLALSLLSKALEARRLWDERRLLSRRSSKLTDDVRGSVTGLTGFDRVRGSVILTVDTPDPACVRLHTTLRGQSQVCSSWL